jgi:diguanylate cyclase (GGDEF)-like protein
VNESELQRLRAALRARERRIVDLERALHRQGMYDPLTGLPNRELLLDRLDHALAMALRHPSVTAVIQIDVDRFGRLNDWLGSEGGDAALVELSRRLRAVLRPGDTLARVGADEFAVLCVQLESERAVHDVATRLLSTLDEPMGAGDREFALTVSAGVALARDGHRRPGDVLADANSALDRAKRRGGMRHEIFDAQLRERIVDRLRIENELRTAVERDELRLEYQPIIGLREGRIVGVEALVRWEHPRLGLLGPDRFVDIAEESGLIRSIGAWVLRHAAAQAAGWRAADPGGPPLELAVNLSARQLSRPDALVEMVTEVLRDTGLPPALLALEITESALVDEGEGALDRLRALGVRLVLDDFGTGYASLAQLKRLRFDAIKVDRSFVASLGLADEGEDALLVAAIIHMATALGLIVVAEGVESARQLRRLSALRCAQGQGYHFARPLQPGTLRELLAAEPPAAWSAS